MLYKACQLVAIQKTLNHRQLDLTSIKTSIHTNTGCVCKYTFIQIQGESVSIHSYYENCIYTFIQLQGEAINLHSHKNTG